MIRTLPATVLDAIPDGLIVTDSGGTILMANRRAHQVFGYEPPELVGQSIDVLVPTELRARHAAHRRTYSARPRDRAMGEASMELLGQARDGRRFPIEVALSVLPGADAPQVLASVRDVSQTRMAQRLLRKGRHDAALLEFGRRILTTGSFDDVLQDVTMELAETVDLGPVWLLQPRPGEHRFSRSVGATAPPPGWLESEGQRLFDALQAGIPLTSTNRRLGDATLPPGMRSATAFPLLDADGSVGGVLLALSRTADAFDADVVKLLEATSSLLSAALQRDASRHERAHAQRLEAVGQLTGGVAHDFNNLLTVIGGNLQLIETNASLDEPAAALVASALRAVDQGAALTRKLLSFAGRQHLRPTVLELPHLLAGLDRLMRATLGERIRLDLRVPPGLPAVYADPGLLDSVLLNLVLNARDAIEGPGTVRIEVEGPRAPRRLVPEGAAPGFVAIKVRDSGCGMSEDVLAHAFDPFFTTKDAGHGTGLGLSMVYGFAQQSGGRVRIESQVGKGTTVTLCLPVATETQRVEPRRTACPIPTGDEMVLLVEDDEAVRTTVRATLKALGYQVVAAASADDALECIASIRDIALLFTDVSLGGVIAGTQLAEMARQLRPDLGVLLTSGYPNEPDAMAGRFALLAKPYHRDDLAGALRREIERMR